MANVKQMGSGNWRCVVRIAGHPQVYKTFPTKKEAERFGRETERELRAGKRVEARAGPTVTALIEEFREIRETGGRPVRRGSNEDHMLRHLDAGLGSETVAGLTPARLEKFCRDRRFGGDTRPNGYTVGMELSKLATVLKMCAVRSGQPVPTVVQAALPLLQYSSLVGEGGERDRRLRPGELEAVLSKLDPQMQDVVRLAVATGLRRGELARIVWEDIDERTRTILVRDRKHPRRKSGNDSRIPLVAATGIDAWDVIHSLPRTSPRIVPLSPEAISDRFLLATRAAQIEDLHFHDLRHEAISRLFEAGWTIPEVAVVSGHSDWRQLKRYTQITPQSLHDKRPSIPQHPEHPRTSDPHPSTSEG